MKEQLQNAKMFAEVLRIQKWAGGESVDAARIFGLMHGFESTILKESEPKRLSDAVQRKVEDMLAEVDTGKLPPDGRSIKDRLWKEEIAEYDAGLVMQLCLLEDRFAGAVMKVVSSAGSVFTHLNERRPNEQQWTGAIHYMELVDCTDGAHSKMHGVFAPAIPRIGEIVTPEGGSTMEVVGVDHVISTPKNGLPTMTPHVLLVAIEDGEEGEEEEA